MKNVLNGNTKTLSIFSLFLILSLVFMGFTQLRSLWHPLYLNIVGARSLDEAISIYAPAAEQRLIKDFDAAQMQYPPQKLFLLAFKQSKQLELWARGSTKDGGWVTQKIKTYPIKAASGKAGPKLREGDQQVPEGLYQIEYYNPNSAYHLSLKLNYPNAFDLKYAKLEGRTKPGSNIFIHGKSVSIGCLAMGDTAIEEIFTLVYRVKRANTQVLIAPWDPQIKSLTPEMGTSAWVGDLYQQLSLELAKIRQDDI